MHMTQRRISPVDPRPAEATVVPETPAPPPSEQRRRTDKDDTGKVPIKVLAVDDDESYRKYLNMLLRKLQFDVKLAANGREAIGLLTSEDFDLVLLDLQMPELNGLDTLKRMRAEDREKSPYAVLLTANADTQTKIEALESGFDDFMSKSTPEPEIKAKLKSAVRIIRSHRKLRRENRRLHEMAITDQLTGIANRRHLFEQAEEVLSSGAQVTMFLFDLDGFKGVNDQYGHLLGDRILADIGTLFLGHTRLGDVVARYGGDEFAMLISGISTVEAKLIARRLRKRIAQLEWTFGDETVRISATVGCASTSNMSSPTIMELFAACDRELYALKRRRQSHAGPDPEEPSQALKSQQQS